MAASGGVVPCPPKRPTIIRPSNNPDSDTSEPVLPARPVPPLPGARPPPPNARPQPALPSRPPEPSSRPQPLPPQRPATVAKPQLASSQSTKPPDRNNSSSVRRRPEITVVSARPMSEVGFRDSKVEIPNSVSSKDNDVISNDHAPPTINQTPPPNPRPGLRGAPPPIPGRTNVEVNHEENEDNSDGGSSVITPDTKTSPLRGPPPPVPRPTVIKPSTPSVSGLPRAPPPVPGRPKDKDQSQTSPSQHMAEQNSELSVKTSPPRPSGAPPTIPRVPSTRQKPPVPALFKSEKSDEIQTDSNQNANEDNGMSDTNNDKDYYAVIEKPKRPTIIRPKKQDTNSENKNNATIPQLPPRLYDNEEGDGNSIDGKENNDLLSFDSPEDHSKIPEFLRKKLKSTTQGSTTESEPVGQSAGSRPMSVSHRGPPPSTKPKPTVLPKPAIALKPSLPGKPVASAKPSIPPVASSDANTNSNSVTKESHPVLPDTGHKTENIRPLVKRPTIIRPSKSGKSGSVENVNEYAGETQNKSVDDSAISSKSQTQPPLPNKRPVSMYNIHKAVENEEEKTFGRSIENNVTKSVENVNQDGLRPKPSPRPATRSRPASMMVPSVARPPPPSTNPRVNPVNTDSSSHSPKPQIRSPSKHLDHDSEVDNSDKSMKPHVPIGVAVLPNMGEFGPPKPVRRPPPPKSSPQKQESSSEDEFVTAKDKLDHPAGPPARPTMSIRRESPSSVRRNSGEDDTKKPPRPGAPPPATKKSSITDSPEKDESVDIRRPPKPEGRPQRPVSTPVKQSPPSKPQPAHQSRAPERKNVPQLPRRPGPGHPLYYHMMQVPHGIALHEFTGEHADDISFKTGDVVILVRSIDAEWMVGKINEKEGMFPRAFVKVKMPLPGEKLDDDVSSEDSSELFYDPSSEKPDNIGHGPRCRARFDFDGEGADDLIFEEGDVIRLIERVGLEWRKGEINGCTGLFPLSFVEVIEDLPETEEEDSSTLVKALFDFDGEEGDLIFQAGEMIKVTNVVNEEWLYGEIGDRKGQFPIQFIDHVPHGLPPLHDLTEDKKDNSAVTHHEDKLSASLAMWDNELTKQQSEHAVDLTPPSSTDSAYCIALYDYPGQTDEDLSFNEGDRIEIIERVSDDWLKGKLHTHTGMFPAAFVDVKVDVTAPEENVPLLSTTQEHQNEHETEPVFGVALYDFNGEADNELTFHTGDRFVVEGPVEGAEDWSWGVVDGHRGMFPSAFVNIDS